MRVILFGATGMVGQGVLRECPLDRDVTAVLTVGRRPTGEQHAKLREIQPDDLFELAPIATDLAGFDACFFCLGISAVGRSEADYRRITYDLTLSVARTLLPLNPDLTFVYVSGMGTDGTGGSRMMWARVKGETENALLALPFCGYMFRPGFIQSLHGIRSPTRLYAAVYAVTRPLHPLLTRLFPSVWTTTERVGQAMIAVARDTHAPRVVETRDINALSLSTQGDRP